MLPTVGILDTGAGPNLVDSQLLPLSWSSKVKPVADPGLTAAGKQTITVEGVILLHVQLGDLRVRVWFGVVKNLAVSVLLGTSFIDRFVTGIFPPERKVVPQNSEPVDIIDKPPQEQ